MSGFVPSDDSIIAVVAAAIEIEPELRHHADVLAKAFQSAAMRSVDTLYPEKETGGDTAHIQYRDRYEGVVAGRADPLALIGLSEHVYYQTISDPLNTNAEESSAVKKVSDMVVAEGYRRLIEGHAKTVELVMGRPPVSIGESNLSPNDAIIIGELFNKTKAPVGGAVSNEDFNNMINNSPLFEDARKATDAGVLDVKLEKNDVYRSGVFLDKNYNHLAVMDIATAIINSEDETSKELVAMAREVRARALGIATHWQKVNHGTKVSYWGIDQNSREYALLPNLPEPNMPAELAKASFYHDPEFVIDPARFSTKAITAFSNREHKATIVVGISEDLHRPGHGLMLIIGDGYPQQLNSVDAPHLVASDALKKGFPDIYEAVKAGEFQSCLVPSSSHGRAELINPVTRSECFKMLRLDATVTANDLPQIGGEIEKFSVYISLQSAVKALNGDTNFKLNSSPINPEGKNYAVEDLLKSNYYKVDTYGYSFDGPDFHCTGYDSVNDSELYSWKIENARETLSEFIKSPNNFPGVVVRERKMMEIQSNGAYSDDGAVFKSKHTNGSSFHAVIRPIESSGLDLYVATSEGEPSFKQNNREELIFPDTLKETLESDVVLFLEEHGLFQSQAEELDEHLIKGSETANSNPLTKLKQGISNLSLST